MRTNTTTINNGHPRGPAALAAAAAALVLGASVAPLAGAGPTTVHLAGQGGTAGVASFTGTATYDDTDHVLTLVLENATPMDRGGYLTGVAFNVAGDGIARYADGDAGGSRGDDDAFDDARGRGKRIKPVRARPFGPFEAGAALDGKWGGRKQAGRGVGAGASHAFTFRIDGPVPAGTTAADFFADPTALAVSFGGYGKRGRGVDLLAGQMVPPKPDPTPAGDDRPVVPGGVVLPPGGLPDGEDDSEPTGPIFPPPGEEQGPNPDDDGTGPGDDGPVGQVEPTAIPLPPTAWGALVTLGVAGAAGARRRVRAWFRG